MQELIVCKVCQCLKEPDKTCSFCTVEHILHESTVIPKRNHNKIPNYDYVLDGEYNDKLYDAYLHNPSLLDNIEEET